MAPSQLLPLLNKQTKELRGARLSVARGFVDAKTIRLRIFNDF